MRIILHKGADIDGVHKVKFFNHEGPSFTTRKNLIPYIEHHSRVKGQKDPDARIIGTEPLSNVRKIKDK